MDDTGNSQLHENMLYKSSIKAKDPFVKHLLKERYKAYRNKIVTICNQRKISFYQTSFQENIENSANVWKATNAITAIKRKTNSMKNI